ncbi:uncharacterized protein F4822DRAFT_414879 [Hypoxylon trugodes]|uniref:uncharacterized protein n=1 Tax=Hypoxylon trugodes TaxID=326681 RepID=UPI0021937982|nr:uncharacterized protein F4822DRAFT_414879 [Hypoxylon trugodes]KAI1384362.1 hypothetical protein F4822DRAFT_414879 [Hypoxylon trugodes]
MAVGDKKSKPGTNGSLKGVNGVNGVNGINGHTVTPRRRNAELKRKSFFTWGFSIIARLLTWYSIFTLLFRCPLTLDECTNATPKICKPYFRVKSAVAPHVIPYYDAYAAPYIDVAKPYYDTIDRIIITPTRTYAVKYGGPKVSQAQAFGQAKWEENVQPELSKYQALAKTRYDQSVAPHIESVATVVSPYYDIARTNALQTYHELLLPAYLFVQPYAAQGYDAAYSFTTDTAIPSTVWAWNKTYAFLDATVWPHVRDVYVMKVEPQLVRIGQRLGRYNENKVKPNIETIEETHSSIPKSSFAKPTTPTSQSVVEPEPEPESQPPASEKGSETPQAPLEMKVEQKGSRTPEEIREHAAKTVTEDLELWEGKFTKAAEEGAAEIEDRVDEIAARMIDRHANGMGKSLVRQLNETATTELNTLKKSIVSILEKNGSDSERDEALAAAIRGAGLKIKEKAQDIRTWREAYDQETEIAVTKAAEEHYNILQKTRDLALQKIGMKWAWMEGVTYKDWKKYHELKTRFDEWTDDFKLLITSHPGLLAAQAAGEEIENEGMNVAQVAASELARLKQIATWKAVAGDSSDNFDSEMTELAAISAIRDAAQSATPVASSVAENIESGAEFVSETANEQLSPSNAETVTVSLSEAESEEARQSSLASTPTDTTSESTSAAAVADSDEPLPSSDPVNGPEQVQETIVEVPDEPTFPVEEPSTITVKSALFGAAAQSVPSRQPILDDEIVSSASSAVSVVQSEVPASTTSAAQSVYTAAIAGAADHYSRAMSVVSAQIHGEPKPVHEEMFSSVSNAYFGAVASANSRLTAAMTAASESVYGTPTTKWLPGLPTVPSVDWERVQSIAQQNLDDSIKWASEQYDAAKVAVGASEPTPSTYLEGAEKQAQKLLDQAKHNYHAGIGLAHDRYSEFLSAASTALSSLTATPTPTNIQGSASSVASIASESVASVASAASENAESLASSVGDLASDSTQLAEKNWDALVSRVSSQVYSAPTPTPWYENLQVAAGDVASAASDYAASATAAAAGQVSSVTVLADDYASSASEAATSQYSAISSLVSELIIGREPPFTESVYSRLAGAYSTGIASASSFASVASDTVASAASEASDTANSVVGDAADKIKETVQHMKDEL